MHRCSPLCLQGEVDELSQWLQQSAGVELQPFLIERLIFDIGGAHASELGIASRTELNSTRELAQIRERLAVAGQKVPALETRERYKWIRSQLAGYRHGPRRAVPIALRSHRPSTHPSRVGFFDIWLDHVCHLPSDHLGNGVGHGLDHRQLARLVGRQASRIGLPQALLRSLINDGIIAGVGSVIVFLPQILMLFFFIGVLEDCGYMARAAFVMDKLMTKLGLSGKSFLPLMSSFACAVPGIMATRVIEDRRDRMVTILIAPLMSCSARLPVYVLLVTTFVPPVSWLGGWIGLQGTVLFAMHVVGLAVAIPVAWLLKKFFFPGRSTTICDGASELQTSIAARGLLSRVGASRSLFDASRNFDFLHGRLGLGGRLFPRRSPTAA